MSNHSSKNYEWDKLGEKKKNEGGQTTQPDSQKNKCHIHLIAVFIVQSMNSTNVTFYLRVNLFNSIESLRVSKINVLGLFDRFTTSSKAYYQGHWSVHALRCI